MNATPKPPYTAQRAPSRHNELDALCCMLFLLVLVSFNTTSPVFNIFIVLCGLSYLVNAYQRVLVVIHHWDARMQYIHQWDKRRQQHYNNDFYMEYLQAHRRTMSVEYTLYVLFGFLDVFCFVDTVNCLPIEESE